MKIIIGCSTGDTELLNNCKDYFGDDNVEVVSRRGFLSVDEIALIIAIADLSVNVISFLHTQLAAREGKDLPKRVIITKEGDLDLEGYEAEGVAKIIESYYGSKNDK